jgi:hypothetical protein
MMFDVEPKKKIRVGRKVHVLIAMPLPMRAGKLPELAEIVRPESPVDSPTPWPRKLKTN